jgi:hypothetical protein
LILCTLRGLVGHRKLVAGFTGKYDKNLTNVTPHNFFLWDETKKLQRRKPPNLMRKELI